MYFIQFNRVMLLQGHFGSPAAWDFRQSEGIGQLRQL